MSNNFILRLGVTISIALCLGMGFGAYTMLTFIPKYSIDTAIDQDAAKEFKKFILENEGYNEIALHIESPGGSVLFQDKIIYYMEQSEASFVCTVDAGAYSAAAIILTYCDDVIMAPKSEIMFHLPRKEGRVISSTYEPDLYKLQKIEKQRIRYLFTDAEWDAMFAGQDIIFDGITFTDRFYNGVPR